MNPTYLLLVAKNIQISMTKNVKMITYETSTKKISFIAGFDSTTNKTAREKKLQNRELTRLYKKKEEKFEFTAENIEMRIGIKRNETIKIQFYQNLNRLKWIRSGFIWKALENCGRIKMKIITM